MESASGKRQARILSTACSFCRKRKRKCDGHQPCSNCIKYKNERNCEFASDQDKRKWKYDSAYVDYLDVKSDILHQYAAELIKNNPEKAQKMNVDINKLYPPMPKLSRSVTSLPFGVNSSALEEIVSTAWRVRKDDKGKTEFYGPLSGRQQVIEQDDDKPSELESTGTDVTFTNSAFRSHLLDLFELHFGFYFYISELTLSEMREWSFPNQELDKHLLLCAVFSYAALYSDHKHTSGAFLAEAEAVALSACRGQLNYRVLQALLILSCYELGMAHDSVSWLFDAMCASQTQFMGLHLGEGQRPDDPISFSNQIVSMSPVKSALFWSIILQDRFITTVLGRGCRIQYFRIQAPFYSPRLSLEAGGDLALSESTFALHSKLWYIHDRSMSQIYSFKADYLHNSHRLILVKQGFSSLQVLYNSFPEKALLKPDTTDRRVLLLHLSYYVVLILLHRSYLSQSPADIMSVLIQDCDKAARLVQRFNYLYGFDQAPYFAGYLIFQCAMFDLFVMANQDEHIKKGSAERMGIYVRGLLSFGKVWRRGVKDIRVLSLLADKWNVVFPLLKEAEALTRSVGEASTPASMDDLKENIQKFDEQFQPYHDHIYNNLKVEDETEMPHPPEFMDTFNFSFAGEDNSMMTPSLTEEDRRTYFSRPPPPSSQWTGNFFG
ncbi:unnamed protein product [Kuraishia capsulata CBS 1993]|uniref:Zn(2)-C6 fungal-type domain-containing protein n=1 Tax=Kuraishia capsulata CBS 1993 TaxID=1382522 RepID=W6MJP6_9ASCO|nr:uncharacterized protein KUCA_T00000683001 [Kuraishia capsulata CBS 1993]CDK24717.1 unnamed protein product [Kuraishia capsulata CBS 1993]